MQKSDVHCLWGHWLVKSEKSRDKKNDNTKKTLNYPIINQSHDSNGGQFSQSGQLLSWSAKKNFCLHCRASQGQIPNTSATRVTAIAVKKNNNIKVDLTQIECYNCYKKGHYTNK